MSDADGFTAIVIGGIVAREIDRGGGGKGHGDVHRNIAARGHDITHGSNAMLSPGLSAFAWIFVVNPPRERPCA